MKSPNFNGDNSLSKMVYQYIYDQIMTGKLAAGQRVTEQAISKSMGISRSPIREALKRLAEDKLIQLIPRRGCYVANISPREISEIYEIRKRLESMALEFAFDKFEKTELQKLLDKFQKCRELPAPELAKNATKLDSLFHKRIAEKSGCVNLQEMLDRLRARIEIFRIREANVEERAKDALQEHIQILNALLTNNCIQAVRALENHIDHTKKNVLSNS